MRPAAAREPRAAASGVATFMDMRIRWSLWLLLIPGLVRAEAATGDRVVVAARAQVGVTTSYDPSYRRLAFPGGDVPIDTGVCADVVVRALRKVGIDLQAELNADMRAHFAAYPQRWGLSRPDRNIDHRRVPNLQRWFERRGWGRPVAEVAPGDIVVWRLDDGRPHTGIVSDRRAPGGQHFLVVHNIASGAREEDVWSAWSVVGIYRVATDPDR
jgi:uncharacterized protein